MQPCFDCHLGCVPMLDLSLLASADLHLLGVTDMFLDSNSTLPLRKRAQSGAALVFHFCIFLSLSGEVRCG